MTQVKDLNNFTPAAITKMQGFADSGITKWNGITYNPAYSGSFYNNVIDYSCMFDLASSSSLTRNNSITADDVTITVISQWAKVTQGLAASRVLWSAYYNTNNYMWLLLGSSGQLRFYKQDVGAVDADYLTTALFRDTSQWYHFVTVLDYNQVAADRVKLYVNGVQLTDFATADTWAGEGPHVLSTDVYMGLGERYGNTSGVTHDLQWDGLMAHVDIIDGVSGLTASDFGEFKGNIWIPKNYAGSYGAAGCHLNFSDNTLFGDDTSGNGHDFADSNMGTDHQLTDTPENNYCTLNYNSLGLLDIFTEGARYCYETAASDNAVLGTFLMKSGKWYWEVWVSGNTNCYYVTTGVVPSGEISGDIIAANPTLNQAGAAVFGMLFGSSAYYVATGGGGTNADTNLAAPAKSDIMMCAFDADTGEFWAGVNGTWGNFGGGVGDPANGTNASVTIANVGLYDCVPFLSLYDQSGYVSARIRFGSDTTLSQTSFDYTPPTGFNAPCTANLPNPVLNDCGDAVDVILWEGTGAENERSDLAFQPDLVWIKNRDDTDSHQLYDSTRGATWASIPDTDEDQLELAQGLKSFDADGFTLGTLDGVNNNGESFVAWCLKESADYGFDIVTYEGTSVAKAISHNLGAVPRMIIVKGIDANSRSWCVYHYAALNKTDPETDYGILETTAAFGDSALLWNDTAPTSTQFTVGTTDSVNGNGETFMAYLFTDIPGLIKCFHYEGNGNANGPYVYCGFRPRWFIYKNADGANSWVIFDVARDTYNVADNYLLAESNAVEAVDSVVDIDVYASGFKIRNTNAATNTNNNTYIGLAVADHPFKYANAR